MTVFTAVWGDYHKWVPEWVDSVEGQADIVVSSDRPLDVPGKVIVSENRGQHPQSARWNEAVAAADTEWCSLLSVDDRLEPEAFDGLPDDCDVWQTGYRGGWDHMPPNAEGSVLAALETNPFGYGSPFRKALWEKVQGFRDLAFGDWAFFRDLGWAGARFAHSGKFTVRYNFRPDDSLSGIYRADHAAHVAAAKTTDFRRST